MKFFPEKARRLERNCADGYWIVAAGRTVTVRRLDGSLPQREDFEWLDNPEILNS